MKMFLNIVIVFMFLSCSDNEPGIGTLDGGSEVKFRYLTIQNGEKDCNLYPLGMIGLAPNETSEPIKIEGDSAHIRYSWENDNAIDTLHVPLKDKPYDSTTNVIVTK